MTTSFDEGFLVGLLIGEGHFGGDGRQPQVTLRMHARHEAMFRHLERTFPGGRLYGPYEHGGRRYFQWMARGPYLREVLVPLLERRLTPTLDRYAYERFATMRATYTKQLGHPAGDPLEEPPSPDASSPTRSEDNSSAAPGASGASGDDPAEAAAPVRADTDVAAIFTALRGQSSED